MSEIATPEEIAKVICDCEEKLKHITKPEDAGVKTTKELKELKKHAKDLKNALKLQQ